MSPTVLAWAQAAPDAQVPLAVHPHDEGDSICSCTEFPRGFYAYTHHFKAEVWRHGPEDSLPVPTWLRVVADTVWHNSVLPQAAEHSWLPRYLAFQQALLGEGMGVSQAPPETHSVSTVPTCPTWWPLSGQKQESRAPIAAWLCPGQPQLLNSTVVHSGKVQMGQEPSLWLHSTCV